MAGTSIGSTFAADAPPPTPGRGAFGPLGGWAVRHRRKNVNRQAGTDKSRECVVLNELDCRIIRDKAMLPEEGGKNAMLPEEGGKNLVLEAAARPGCPLAGRCTSLPPRCCSTTSSNRT
jgi:hypothetical protein